MADTKDFQFPTKMLAVLDLETLGIYDDAVILSLGLVVDDLTGKTSFDELVNNPKYNFSMKFDVREQIVDMGRSVEESCKNFWNGKGVTDEARKFSYFPDKARDVSVRTLKSKMNAWLHLNGMEGYHFNWCDRNMFDISKLDHLFVRTLKDPTKPWDYRNVFDLTTFLLTVSNDRYGGLKPSEFPTMVYHNPVHDAALDFIRIRNQYSILHESYWDDDIPF